MPQPFSILAIAIAAWQSLLHWWCFIPVRAMPQKPLHNKVNSWARWRVTLQHANSIQLHQTITGLHCSIRFPHGRSWKIVVPLKVHARNFLFHQYNTSTSSKKTTPSVPPIDQRPTCDATRAHGRWPLHDGGRDTCSCHQQSNMPTALKANLPGKILWIWHLSVYYSLLRFSWLVWRNSIRMAQLCQPCLNKTLELSPCDFWGSPRCFERCVNGNFQGFGKMGHSNCAAFRTWLIARCPEAGDSFPHKTALGSLRFDSSELFLFPRTKRQLK